MNTETKHTLTVGLNSRLECNGRVMADMTYDPDENYKANAARLAHAWNTHDELLAIAEGVMIALAYPRGSEAQVRCLEEVGDDARAAIAKATKP